MENQHRQIKGYRELSQTEIDLMNEVKAVGPQLDALFKKIKTHIEQQRVYADHQAVHENNSAELERIKAAEPDKWISWASDTTQTALMYATRSIAQPTFF
jgi:hypothetical protein